MASPQDRGQSILFSSKHSSFLTNLLLILNLIGIIIIIILLLWWWPWWWGHGWGSTSVIGANGGAVSPGPGGNIIIDTCCNGRTTDCLAPNGKKTCEEECKEITGGSPAAYEKCIVSRCGKPTDGCEDQCEKRYSSDTYMISECVRIECNNGNGCTRQCWENYGTAGLQPYTECVQRECNPPPTETCEDYCKTVYGSPGMENYYQDCLGERCGNPTTTKKEPDCRDSDGYNLGSPGEVHYGDEVHKDTCYSATEVTEWVCDGNKPKQRREPCEGRCEYGRCVPTTTTTTTTDPCREYCEMAYGYSQSQVDQCVQQHWCPV